MRLSKLFIGQVIYVPALAFNQTTGVDIHTITPIVMTICIFYTCLGGIKAVVRNFFEFSSRRLVKLSATPQVWTDVIQIILMYGTLALIVIKGTISVGGFSVVMERNYGSGRFEAPE